jgi:small subunit ribosomal protein S1
MTEKDQSDIDARLDAEIESALGDMSIDDLLNLEDAPARSGGRQKRTGTIIAVHGNDVLVEFGPRAQGACPLDQFQEQPKAGERQEFIIDRFDKGDGMFILSRRGSISKAEWESLDIGQTIEARCTGTNKGGLEMEVAHHSAFMPAGQVDVRHQPDLSVFVGEKMVCEVLEIDRRRGRIILSRRAPLEAQRAETRVELMQKLEVGQQLPAVISSIQDYGAFADIGGLDGLIHISDISYERIKNPSQVLKEGQQVTVQILKIDKSHDPPRIGLGMKQCMADPFQSTLDNLNAGDTISGRVTKTTAFGAFVEISKGVEGLIHISELSHERVNKVAQVVKPDQIVTAQVLKIDPAQKRISLSIKALKDKGEETSERKDDPQMRKLREQLNKNFGELKGGIG